MRLISDDILEDDGTQDPVHERAYPSLETDFLLWDPNSWTRGHPFELYKRMREDAPVMWSPMKKGASGFWSVTRYEDIKSVELAPEIFSSQRGGINYGCASAGALEA